MDEVGLGIGATTSLQVAGILRGGAAMSAVGKGGASIGEGAGMGIRYHQDIGIPPTTTSVHKCDPQTDGWEVR